MKYYLHIIYLLKDSYPEYIENSYRSVKDNPIDKWGKGLKALNKIVNLYCQTANKHGKKLSLIKSSQKYKLKSP